MTYNKTIAREQKTVGREAAKGDKQTLFLSLSLPGYTKCHCPSTTYTKTERLFTSYCMGSYCPCVMRDTRMLGIRLRCSRFQKQFRTKIPNLGHLKHVLEKAKTELVQPEGV